MRGKILDQARATVLSDRNHQYGEPVPLLDAIAEVQAVIDRLRRQGGHPRDGVYAALDLVALRLCRAAINPGHLDSWVDGAGYFAIGGELAARRAPAPVVQAAPAPAPAPVVVAAPVATPAPAPVAAPPAPAPAALANPAPAKQPAPAKPTKWVEPAPGTHGGAWTAAEDDRLVAAMLAARGATVAAVVRDVMPDLPGRTPGAIAYRIRNRLMDRIEAGLRAPAPAPAPKPPSAPAVAPTPQPAPAAGPAPRVREVVAALDANPAPGWSPADDLRMVEENLRGNRLDAIAGLMGRPLDDCRARWSALRAAVVGRGDWTLDAQAVLLAALRWRAKEAA